jgi:CxxC motif-containing protein (DUF1111 family)
MQSARRASRIRLSMLVCTFGFASAQAGNSDAPIGVKPFEDPHNPPSYRPLDASESSQVKLGLSIFNTLWAAAGTAGVEGRVGIGPLFNANSCNACHHDGGRARGPAGDGPAPTGLVIQLASPPSDDDAEPRGDPTYGRVFNTLALVGVQVEGAVTVTYSEIAGYYYPFGGRWNLRVPHYQLTALGRGPLSPDTIIKPRLAPALFGVGLLEAIPEAAIRDGSLQQADSRVSGGLAWHVFHGARQLGRLGWQNAAVSIRDQTTIAFAGEMGLTSAERYNDDCTAAEEDCRAQPNGGAPEVSEELLNQVVAFLSTLAVPRAPLQAEEGSPGAELFARVGCAECHRPSMPAELHRADGTTEAAMIAPYTDLRLHNLGNEMADQNAAGARVVSVWRTAPLWGLGYRLSLEGQPTFLHDGRARTAEEAILWHSGEAVLAKRKFMNLGPRARGQLLHWLETL